MAPLGAKPVEVFTQSTPISPQISQRRIFSVSLKYVGNTSSGMQAQLNISYHLRPKKRQSLRHILQREVFLPPPGNGVNGTARMPYLPGPMFWKSDLTTLKNFKIGEKQSLQLRVAAFNPQPRSAVVRFWRQQPQTAIECWWKRPHQLRQSHDPLWSADHGIWRKVLVLGCLKRAALCDCALFWSLIFHRRHSTRPGPNCTPTPQKPPPISLSIICCCAGHPGSARCLPLAL